jgi:serine/threonine-protein kinase
VTTRTPAAGLSSGLFQRPAAATTVADLHAVQHSLEANMPEAMAMLKLKGFIGDLGGNVVESVPGMIRVRLPNLEADEAKPQSGLFAWKSRSRPVHILKASSTDLELRMERKDPTQTSRLTITLILRSANGIVTPEWRTRSQKIARDLQAYLMGR